jgi:HK97 family phage prohead protease/HK97 family phage major capsid protein
MKVNIPMVVTAADTIKRTITGTIVTWNEQGNTSVGPTVFAANSIEIKPVKLLLEHDRTRPIGKMVSHNVTKSGIEATFKIANTMAGEDALVEATEGLRDGFSVGAQINEWTNNKGVMQITSASLEEVSLVTDPAIDSARVAEVVAASENETTKEDSDPATADSDKPTEGDQVSDTTAPAPAVDEAVEAAKVEATSPRPAFYTRPRLDPSPVKYLEATIKASLGDESARQYVAAAADTTDNAGLVPTRQLSEVINGLANTTRSNIDAISTGVLPDAGMSFEIPKITTMPTVAEVAEAGAPSETDQAASFVTVSVKKASGAQKFSVELLDRSSPLFLTELLNNMSAQFAKVTDTAVNAALISGATADSTTIATYPTASELLGFVSRGAASVYSGTQGFARNIIANTSQWANLMTLNDSGRPIYNAQVPQNAGGVVAPTSVRGNVAGLDLYVTANTASTTDTDGSMLIVNPASYTYYESPTFQLRADVIASGEVYVSLYGYYAIATKLGAGAFKFNKT